MVVPLGFAWKGTSRLDGSPIVMVLTGFRNRSRNPKTGDMIQVWILPATVDPRLAVATGQDVSVCGDCPRRPDADRTGTGADDGIRCYVRSREAPLTVWRAWKAGRYLEVRLDGSDDGVWMPWVSGRPVRLGAYGDPVAVPLDVVRRLLLVASAWTGYTHQWKGLDASDAAAWRRIVMASADTVSDAVRARWSGWRTFRVGPDMETPKAFQAHGFLEIHCPASPERGARTDCARCGLCSGVDGKGGPHLVSVRILPHGSGRGARAPELAVALS